MALTNFIQLKNAKAVLSDIERLKTEFHNSKISVVKDKFKITNPTLPEQKVFTLSSTPVSANSIEFFLNGIHYDVPDIEYDNQNNTVTWVSQEEIDLTDADVVIRYNTMGSEGDASSEGGAGGIELADVSDATIKESDTQISLKWTDPADVILYGTTIATWAGTLVVRKVGSAPESKTDGTVVLDSKSRNAYASTAFVDANLTNGTTYYYRFFPYTRGGTYTEGTVLSAKPIKYLTMTVKIDLSNSNPETALTYDDDATTMTAGDAAWDDFFGHYPVMLKNGVEGKKLNPSNFEEYADGTTADITSGDEGDVMIAFPRRGLKISTSGNILTISMTDNPDDSSFSYLAHKRGNTNKDVFYLGAYKGYTINNRLCSLSQKTIAVGKTVGQFRTLAQANGQPDGNGGSGYDQSGFYQLVFRQAMYILKYKNLDSQTAVGRGYVDENSAAIATGGTEAKGMDWGETTGKQHMKLFGIEDFWGNIWEWIDGCVTDANRNILTATDNFNDAGTGYTSHASGVTSNIGNYMNKPQGTTETGFLAKEVSGSATTYFCDSVSLCASCVAIFGGIWADASFAGAFRLGVYAAASRPYAFFAARLMYL